MDIARRARRGAEERYMNVNDLLKRLSRRGIGVRPGRERAAAPDGVAAMGVSLARAAVAGLEHVWTIGHTMLFFRPSRTRDTRYPLPV